MRFLVMKEKIIRLKECFKVSKTEDHYQQFDSLCHSSLFFCRFPLIRLFSFFIAFLGHTHFILVITFSCDLGMPPSIELLGLFCLFGFLSDFS